MNFLVDTNLLTRALQPHHPMHAPAKEAVQLLLDAGELDASFPKTFMMIVHGVPRILTFNKADFVRYAEIVAVTPDEIIHAAKAP